MEKETPQNKRRQNQKEKQVKQRKSKRICIPIEEGLYKEIIEDVKRFREYLELCLARYPELFPSEMRNGYKCIGFCERSKRLPEVRLRRIYLKSEGESYQIAPSFVMPYMTGYSKDVEKAMYLHFKYEVPFDGLVYVFGKNESYWYRQCQQLGRFSLVGTTTKGAKDLPENIAADEKHTRWNGQNAYVATTVGEGCFWGASICLGADELSFNDSYKVFKEEAQIVQESYEPKTVNTDGFFSTVKVWKKLFTTTVFIRCFLHAYLKIRNVAKHLDCFDKIADYVWDAYKQPTYESFINKMTFLQLWAELPTTLVSERCLNTISKVCGNAHDYAIAYDHPHCLRTSNMLDRLMQKMDRYLFMMRYFHGHLDSAELSIRAWALAHNFLPFCSRSDRYKSFSSPVHQLTQTTYHDNWLQNLLISASLQPILIRTQNSLE